MHESSRLKPVNSSRKGTTRATCYARRQKGILENLFAAKLDQAAPALKQ
jgi:hypothetical protein